MTFQFLALRLVVKQTDGVRVSAANDKPSDIIGEEDFTAGQPAQGMRAAVQSPPPQGARAQKDGLGR